MHLTVVLLGGSLKRKAPPRLAWSGAHHHFRLLPSKIPGWSTRRYPRLSIVSIWMRVRLGLISVRYQTVPLPFGSGKSDSGVAP